MNKATGQQHAALSGSFTLASSLNQAGDCILVCRYTWSLPTAGALAGNVVCLLPSFWVTALLLYWLASSWHRGQSSSGCWVMSW